MIGKLTGTIESHSLHSILVDVHDVGYVVSVPNTLISQTRKGDACTLFIHTHVREDALELYGFNNQKELDLFELLLIVPGIGPKTALAVMDRGADAIVHAVRTGDVDFFTTIPRLGKKNAQKIIIELKNKLGGLKDLDLSRDTTGETRQLIDALASMGFDHKEIVETVGKLDEKDSSLELKIRHALKLLGKTR